MPATLHVERIARTHATPARWLLLTHGIYGSGMNWRGIARKIHERRQDWGIALVDLRHHGRSEGGEPPHTIDACARDLAALGSFDAIAGHSFGGKVVMAAKPMMEPVQTWILDSSPSARPEAIRDRSNSVIAILELMERLPKTWPKREDFAAAVIAEGHTAALANWLAMNIVDGRLRFDLAAIREMLTDYFARDLWHVIDDTVEYVIAGKSSTVSVEDRARLPHAHVIDAGHWLHIEAPDAVVQLFATRLP